MPMLHSRRQFFASATAIAGLAALPATARAGSDRLKILYNRAAQEHFPDQNPVIVIPGILGTRLVDGASGETVWGAFDGISPNSSDKANVSRLAFPFHRQSLGPDLADLRPDAVLDRVRVRLLGVPFQLRQYAQILSTLGAAGYRDETLHPKGLDYGPGHISCFQFPYDWRRDNAETALALKQFMDERRLVVADGYREYHGYDVAPESIRFDVVAHSMGAVMFRYFMRYGGQPLDTLGAGPTLDWAGAAYVDRAILVAPPNGGSGETMRLLLEGQDFGRPVAPRYPPSVLGSFPSVYQLLPRPWSPAIEGVDGQRLFEAKTWIDRGWGIADPDQAPVLERLLPEVSDPDRRRHLALDHLEVSLKRAQKFHTALDSAQLAPIGFEPFLVAGDAVPTPERYRYDAQRKRLTVVSSAPGDGAVTRSSALLDHRTPSTWTPRIQSPLRFRSVLFTEQDHLGLTRTDLFSDNLLFWLLEEQRGENSVRYSI
ncbi:lipase/acyltransferase domain-containing protein (plasmid) [Caulobacter sp. ErkDOM-YI]|uniref:lipase/acyltransferase domain-containing protein n=1 Tax=unclassified Caulobacter TaxID=2648921 RepID=UPI003AF611C5